MPCILRNYSVLHCPVREIVYEGTPGFRFDLIPPVTPNFIYLDGPTLTKERAIVTNPLDMEPSFPPDFCLVIDGRVQLMEFLRTNFKRDYHFEHRIPAYNALFVLSS